MLGGDQVTVKAIAKRVGGACLLFYSAEAGRKQLHVCSGIGQTPPPANVIPVETWMLTRSS